MCAKRRVATWRHWLRRSMVGDGACGPFEWPKMTSAITRVPFVMWLDISEQPPGPDRKGELLHVGGSGNSRSEVAGCCAFRSRAGALIVPLGLHVAQSFLSPEQGCPHGWPASWLAGRVGVQRSNGPAALCVGLGGVRSGSGARRRSRHLWCWCGWSLSFLGWPSSDGGAAGGMLRRGSPGGLV